MINIQPIKAFNDNYIWAITNSDNNELIVVDPGQADPVKNFIDEYHLKLIAIWVTHKHYDHTGGVEELCSFYQDVIVIAHKNHGVVQNMSIEESSDINAWNYNVKVWSVPGHTEHHLAYLLYAPLLKSNNQSLHVFCGDTLFSGGCGRVFSGDIQAMYESLQRFASLDDATLFYPAHEYTLNNLNFGLYVDPHNIAMKEYKKALITKIDAGEPSLPSQLAQEKKVNVFLRVQDKRFIDSLKDKVDLLDETPVAVFSALRELKDHF